MEFPADKITINLIMSNYSGRWPIDGHRMKVQNDIKIYIQIRSTGNKSQTYSPWELIERRRMKGRRRGKTKELRERRSGKEEEEE